MPHIRIRSLSEAAVATLSRELPKTLAPLMSTPEDNFTVELIGTTFYSQGKIVEGDPMIEVQWFDRGQATQDACAAEITFLVRQHTKSEFIAVVFTALPKTSYYENGTHF
ncbi:MAG: DUF1904 domain-containing protein [Bdellovibrionota bacterium]